MRTAFVDAAYYIALLNSRDQHAISATELASQFNGWFVTTTWVLTEVCNLLSGPGIRTNAATLIVELEEAMDTEIIHPDQILWKRTLTLYASRSDKSWSLTDYMSFIVMQDRGITEALTTDRHFEQAGFTILLK